MNVIRASAMALLEFAYPERCGLCGVDRSGTPWTSRGGPARGLRWWDRTQLCLSCLDSLRTGGPLQGHLVGDGPPVWAAAVTGRPLVKVVGLWKYHGLRGLAWPLAGLMADALAEWQDRPVLVPVALHRRRRRERGFNQAEVVGGLVASLLGWSLDTGVLMRRRSTAQQARITDDEARRGNLAGAFVARPPARGDEDRPLMLVDDLVTSGATVQAAVVALQAVGWRVCGILALGLATGSRGDTGPVDTRGGGF